MICITMGDANGIGPEVLLNAAAAGELAGEYVVCGDRAVLETCARTLGIAVELRDADPAAARGPSGGAVDSDGIKGQAPAGPPGRPAKTGIVAVDVVDLGMLRPEDVRPGTLSRESGDAAARYVEKATRLALAGDVSAIVTLPINKEATRLSHPGFTGHTELIAGICNQSDYTMMLMSERLAVTHVSTHVAIAEAVKLVTRRRVGTVIRLTYEALSRFHDSPRIAVAGLNPHAGEHGSFGTEDEAEIRPAVEAARELGWNISGPEAPDTVFHRASRGMFDGVVCMYHDQGHIPMKLLDFDGAVNITLGLDVIRTSVDHGTAFDIAWQGKASTRSFVQAYRIARKLAGEPDR